MAKKFEVGIQFWPWYDLPTLLDHAKEALRGFPFHHIWLCDEFQYEDTFTILTAMATRLDVSLGTMVTFPWRNPLELAQRFASMAKLLPEGRQVVAGLGAGGAVQEQVVAEKTNPTVVIRETIRLLRGLFRGEAMALSEFPHLASRFCYNRQTKARLYFPAEQPVPVFLGAGGPKTCQIAGELADGVILTQLHARTSATAMAMGMFDQAVQEVEAGKQGRADEGFRTIYKLNFSVSRDGRRARDWAKRNTSYALASFLVMYPQALKMAGLDLAQVGRIREAYLQGLGVEEGARRVTDEILERAGFVFAGTPDDCLKRVEEVSPYVRKYQFDQLVVGVPLGPDVPEALSLISREIMPPLLRMLEDGR